MIKSHNPQYFLMTWQKILTKKKQQIMINIIVYSYMLSSSELKVSSGNWKENTYEHTGNKILQYI